MAEEAAVGIGIALELLCLPEGLVAVALHLKNAANGTPVKSFRSERSEAACSETSAFASDADSAASTLSFSTLLEASPLAADVQSEGAAAGGDGGTAGSRGKTSMPAAPDPARPSSSCSGSTVQSAVQIGAHGTAAAAPRGCQSDAAVGPAASVAGKAQSAESSQGPTTSGATLEAVMGMLQRLLSSNDSMAAQGGDTASATGPAAAPSAAANSPCSTAPTTIAAAAGAASSMGAGSSAGLLPAGVEKLLSLELEVVQLQQSLQIAQLEFETRTVQIHALKQRADEAEQRAQAAEQRSAGLAQQAHQLERQVGDLRCQLGEATTRHQQDTALLSARLSAAAAKQQAAEEAAACLRQRLHAAQQASDKERALLRKAAAQQTEWRERAAALKQESQQLRAHVAAACGALKALGVPATKVFSRAALAVAGQAEPTPRYTQSPPESPLESPLSSSDEPELHDQALQPLLHQHRQQQDVEQLAAADGRVQQLLLQHPQGRPPQVPRLQLSGIGSQLQQQHLVQQQGTQSAASSPSAGSAHRMHLSSISLEQLQQQASQQQQEPPPQQRQAVQQAHPPGQGQQRPPMSRTSSHAHSVASEQLEAADSFAHVLVAADGSSALGHRTGESPRAAHAGARAAAGTVQQWAPEPAPPLSARPVVTATQQELLAAAQQWQLSARSAAGTIGDMPAYQPHNQQQRQQQQHPGASPASARCLRAIGGTAVARSPLARRNMATPRAGAGAGPGTPGNKLQPRLTYGQDSSFLEIKQAYHAVMSSEADRASKWARSVLSSSSAVETDPRKVEPVLQGLLQLFEENGVHIPLQKCGPCQYRLGTAKLAVRLVNGRLMARSGAGQTMDVFAWLEKQPVVQ